MTADSVKKTIYLYSGLGWKSIFAKVRFWDAPYVEVEKIVPKKGTITDLGCGDGIFTNFLALTSPKRKLTGIDIDSKRLTAADKGLKNVQFKLADANKVNLPKSDAVILFHLLHHLKSQELQTEVLRKCIDSLRKNGKIIIIEIDVKFSFKYFLTLFTDHLIVPWFFDNKLYEPKIFFRHTKEWLILLNDLGLSCKVIMAEENKPFTHIIFNCHKR
ncbi:class I SAM-dependent methyltransferase [Candidatus Microgenomates bacterium]|nr:class I SAM-dependent methyltransferase [Candidatus Microgenomates bacterium]